MSRKIWIGIGAILVAGVGWAGEVREVGESRVVKAHQAVRLEFPVGELRVEPAEGDRASLEIEARCERASERCERALERVRIEIRESDKRLSFEVAGRSSWGRSKIELDGILRLPAEADLEIEMGVGELDLRGMRGDLRVDLGVGDVEARLDGSAVGTVHLDAGIGEAELRGVSERIEGRRSLLVGSEISWNAGAGRSRVEIDVGVGEISVRLD